MQASVVGGTGNEACDDDSTVAGGVQNAVNSGADTGPMSFIAAGNGNTVFGVESFVGAGTANTVSSSTAAAIVAGASNSVQHANESFIGAGTSNSIVDAQNATILGGQNNTITSVNGNTVEASGAYYGTIGGGYGNTIAAKAASGGAYGFIGGGEENLVTGEDAVVAGGAYNVASGYLSTVPGGYGNVAAGTLSFAAGYESQALTTGSFVWSDYSPSAPRLTSTRANQFLVRATGGVTFLSGAGPNTGVTLAPGSGTWSSVSDRNLKVDITPIHGREILRRIAVMPVSEWSYISEPGVRHIGPMAQDFYAAFHLGEDDRHIATIDEDGIVLAAVKELAMEQRSLERQISIDRAELAYLRQNRPLDKVRPRS
jgi:hypothetical protein